MVETKVTTTGQLTLPGVLSKSNCFKAITKYISGNVLVHFQEIDFEVKKLQIKSKRKDPKVIANIIRNETEGTRENYSVFFSGNKGMGKTDTMKIVARELNNPIIVINSIQHFDKILEEIPNYIKGKVTVILDEFKASKGATESYSFETLLQIFDGVEDMDIVFLIASNYFPESTFSNRPSRINMHIVYNHVLEDEWKNIVDKNVKGEERDVIYNILYGCSLVSYDVIYSLIRAVSLNKFLPFEEFVFNLNIDSSYFGEYQIKIDDEVIRLRKSDLKVDKVIQTVNNMYYLPFASSLEITEEEETLITGHWRKNKEHREDALVLEDNPFLY